ncbi:MAG: NAD-dependent epimerase/dehydratase family protein [Candidatus Brocadiia bacterium]
MAIEGKRVFVTGGAGFIASHLIERLVGANEVTVYDNFRRNALAGTGLAEHPRVRVVRGDVLEAERLARAARGHQVFVHAAAIAGVDTVLRNTVATMQVNMLGTYHALEAASGLERCERFVDFSTSEVFGAQAYKMGEEATTHLGAVGEARWTYAVSKLAGEHLCHAYHKERGLPTVVVRPFNVYGPRQVGEGAIHVFVTRALRGLELQIHGDGDQIRSWCYISDLVDGLMLCLERGEAVGQCFSIGNPRGTVTVYGLALAVLRACGSASPIVFVPKPYVDVDLRMPNIEKARRELGYEPKVHLEEGLRRTAAWYRQEMDAEGEAR